MGQFSLAEARPRWSRKSRCSGSLLTCLSLFLLDLFCFSIFSKNICICNSMGLTAHPRPQLKPWSIGRMGKAISSSLRREMSCLIAHETSHWATIPRPSSPSNQQSPSMQVDCPVAIPTLQHPKNHQSRAFRNIPDFRPGSHSPPRKGLDVVGNMTVVEQPPTAGLLDSFPFPGFNSCRGSSE
jgi:hypothetical protein